METHYFECQCSDFGHVFRLCIDPQDGDIWMEVQMVSWDPWYKRLWTAVKYVFTPNTPRPYGHYDTTLLRIEDYDRIRDLLNRSEMTKAGNLSRAREQQLRVQ